MFSAAILDRVANPRNEGPLEKYTHYGVAGTPGEGPHLELWLDVDDDGDTIRRAAYRTYSCPAAIACGSLIAQLATGRSMERVTSLTARDIDLMLGGLPEGKERCAGLGISALLNATRHPCPRVDQRSE